MSTLRASWPSDTLMRDDIEGFAVRAVKFVRAVQTLSSHMNRKMEVVICGNPAIALWLEAIEAAASHGGTIPKDVALLRESIKDWLKKKYGATRAPIPVFIRGCEELEHSERKIVLEDLFGPDHEKGCIFAGASFQVTFRESGEGNRPATRLRLPKTKSFETILPSGKVLVDDPTRLVFCVVTWLMAEHKHLLALPIQEDSEAQQDLEFEFYNGPLWINLIVLSHLFHLLRPYDTKIRPPLWTQAPFREREWDATIDILPGMNDERKRGMQDWMKQAVVNIHDWQHRERRKGLRVDSADKFVQALEYFTPFFEPYLSKYEELGEYRDDPNPTLPTNDDFHYPSYPPNPHQPVARAAPACHPFAPEHISAMLQ